MKNKTRISSYTYIGIIILIGIILSPLLYYLYNPNINIGRLFGSFWWVLLFIMPAYLLMKRDKMYNE